MYLALGGDVSLRPKPYVTKWGPRVGQRAARLQWFARTGTLVVGGCGLFVGLLGVVLGTATHLPWMKWGGIGLLTLGSGVATAGFLCLLMSVSAMSKFFGESLTLRSSPLLSDDQFTLWCQQHGIATQHDSA